MSRFKLPGAIAFGLDPKGKVRFGYKRWQRKSVAFQVTDKDPNG